MTRLQPVLTECCPVCTPVRWGFLLRICSDVVSPADSFRLHQVLLIGHRCHIRYVPLLCLLFILAPIHLFLYFQACQIFWAFSDFFFASYSSFKWVWKGVYNNAKQSWSTFLWCSEANFVITVLRVLPLRSQSKILVVKAQWVCLKRYNLRHKCMSILQ